MAEIENWQFNKNTKGKNTIDYLIFKQPFYTVPVVLSINYEVI